MIFIVSTSIPPFHSVILDVPLVLLSLSLQVLPELSCFIMISITTMKHHDQKLLREERVHFTLQLISLVSKVCI